MKKRIAVLGITGSIGQSTIEIVKHHPEAFEIVFASANTDYDKLLKISKELNINKIALSDSEKKINHQDDSIKFYQGHNELISLIENENYDILLNAVTGSAGLPYTIAVLSRGKDLALANKESLVMAGHLVKSIIKKTHSKVLPVDSEHSAIFQVIHGHQRNEIRNLHITASGGPFRTIPLDDFEKIDLKQALKHPTWEMGTKVTIDSATMMNKGLEVIEAHWLFDIEYANIKAIIHPQSIIHSIVEFVDGSMLAQMSTPTMQLPILYALSYPIHYPSEKVQTTLETMSALTFEAIDKDRYPLFYIACQAGNAGGIMPTVLNAANESALELFINSHIKFTEISKIVEKTLNSYENISNPDLETIFLINKEVKEFVLRKYI